MARTALSPAQQERVRQLRAFELKRMGDLWRADDMDITLAQIGIVDITRGIAALTQLGRRLAQRL